MSEQHRVGVVGALGRMGVNVRAAIQREPALVLGGALEVPGHPMLGSTVEDRVRVTDDAKEVLAKCDVAIDFSVPAATLANLRSASEAGVAYVTGTTGFDEKELEEIEQLAQRIPIIRAANFSVSVNILIWLVEQAASMLGPDFDAELFEMHHVAKRDAPSGTAMRLAQAVADGRGVELADKLILERAGDIGPRPDGAIGVQTLRGGDCPGEHTAMFIGQGERIELVHRSHTRDHFARGAVRAAVWLAGREPGLYKIEQVLDLAG